MRPGWISEFKSEIAARGARESLGITMKHSVAEELASIPLSADLEHLATHSCGRTHYSYAWRNIS